MKNIKKRKKFEEFSEDTSKQIDYIESKQGPIMEQIDEGVRVGDIEKGADVIKGDKIYDYTKKATGGRVPLDGGGWPGMEEYYKETVAPDIDKKISDLMKNFKHYRERGGKKDLRDYINTWGIGGGLKEGGRVPLVLGELVKPKNWKLFKKFIDRLFIKSSNDIRLNKGIFKGLTEEQRIMQHDNLTKLSEKFRKTGEFDKGANQYFGFDAEKAFKYHTNAKEVEVLEKFKPTGKPHASGGLAGMLGE